MTEAPDKVKVIAEVGCNHKGDLGVAKDLIQVASRVCKADVVRFHKRANRESLSSEQYNVLHPVQLNAYRADREFLEFDIDQHRELIDECVANDILYSTSVWDLTVNRRRTLTPYRRPILTPPRWTDRDILFLALVVRGEGRGGV